MKKFLVLYKKEGETPLQALENWRQTNKRYKDTKMTYAGRLDPMAQGLLLVLLGEEIRKKELYLSLDKEYEFEVLFGIATDTYDILGKITHTDVTARDLKEEEVKKALKSFKGRRLQQYPPYSSRTVNGRPLWELARRGETIEAPTRDVVINKIILKKIRTVSPGKLTDNIEKRIRKVKGDFRQAEIIKSWKKGINSMPARRFYIACLKMSCSSGTYARAVANDLGCFLGVPALAYSIKRTRIGKFDKIKI